MDELCERPDFFHGMQLVQESLSAVESEDSFLQSPPLVLLLDDENDSEHGVRVVRGGHEAVPSSLRETLAQHWHEARKRRQLCVFCAVGHRQLLAIPIGENIQVPHTAEAR